MCDFDQGLWLGDALRRCFARRSGPLLVRGANCLRQPRWLRPARRELKTPVQLGENFYGPHTLYQAIISGAGDFVMPDLMRIGGVSGWLRSAAITGEAGIPMSTHLYPEVAAHLMRVTETAHWLEWQDFANPVLAEPFQLKNGHLVIPDVPGSGISWDEDAVRRYAA